MIAALLLGLGCTTPPPPGELIFVRGGVIAPVQTQGRALAGGRTLVEEAWLPGERHEIAGVRGVAPQMAECAPLFHVSLGDVSRLIAMGGTAPDTALAWSPRGDRLAIGAYTGELVVVDGWTGAELARRALPEAMVKRVAWSPDGQTLYAAEQSPDAHVMALDPATLETRWSLRLADEVGTSAAPPGDDLYGVYSLPTASALIVLDGGDLLVAATHGWNDADGRRLNRARLLRLRPGAAGAERVAAWPAEVADAIFQHVVVDEASGRLAVTVNRSADGAPPADLPVGGVQILTLADLSPGRAVVPGPLPPYFKTAFLWEAVDVEGASLLLGLGDGRVQRVNLDSGATTTIEAGTPVLSGEVPIAASVGHGLLHRGAAIFLTSNTNIPWGAAAPELRPPSAHPGENTLWVYGADGELDWTWRGPQRVEGLTLGPDGRTLVVGAGERVSDERQDLFGAMIFDLADAPAGGVALSARGGDERLQAFCATEGPVFFRQALSEDGRVALSEHPWRAADGRVEGAYQVTVAR